MKRPKRLPPTAPAPLAFSLPPSAFFALVAFACFLVYWPSMAGDFLWDDAGHVTNPALQSWSGLWRIWFEPGATQQYYPLLHTAFWIEHRIWGDATVGYHFINILWHSLSACLFAAILCRLSIRGALLAAFVFALHPVCVESVAWISEQKNTLSTVFYLAAALAWLRFEDDRRPSRYVLALLLFVAALLTKSVTATLPAALLVVVWWRRGRLSWRGAVLPLLPWFALGILAGLGTAWFERSQIGAGGAEFEMGIAERVLLAGRVVWFYLGKLLWPVGLTFFYPRWAIDVGVAWQWLFPSATLLALGLGAWWSRRNRGPLAALLLFGGTLFPVLGFVDVYPFVFSFVADHFQYLASLGMIAFFSAVAVEGFARLRCPSWVGPVAALLVLLVLANLTWRQSGNYRDSLTLYEATLQRSPDSWVTRLNLGTTLDDLGQTREALPHLQRANELKPDFPETLNSLGNVLNRLGRPSEAVPLLERSIELQPTFALARNTLGVSLMSLGSADVGLASFRQAVEIDPSYTVARVNLGWALANAGRTSEALAELERARLNDPASADAELKTALVYALLNRPIDALKHGSRAVELQPYNADIRQVLGTLLLDLGRPAEGIAQLEEALRLAPDHPGTMEVLSRLGRSR